MQIEIKNYLNKYPQLKFLLPFHKCLCYFARITDMTVSEGPNASSKGKMELENDCEKVRVNK